MSRPTEHHSEPNTGLVSLWRDFVRDLFDGYRPERHYMRGPGPKCRAKHGEA